ncbi:hypothetical protein SAMN05444141_103606 [Pseudovibrio denitrificans]|uniref:Uncharacterized protein n=1 Tax=Pseudovibrio denitrificans TaxID=258256 RepID=A0A1I7B3V9_9HYPH|nr:hypothetical protein SAMN05444141_103606 [Pseudovibrio denitrificans]
MCRYTIMTVGSEIGGGLETYRDKRVGVALNF